MKNKNTKEFNDSLGQTGCSLYCQESCTKGVRKELDPRHIFCRTPHYHILPVPTLLRAMATKGV